MPPKTRKATSQGQGGGKEVPKAKKTKERNEVDVSLIRTDKRISRPRTLDDGRVMAVKEMTILSKVTEESEDEQNPQSPFEIASNKDIDSSSESPDEPMSEDDEEELEQEKVIPKKAGAGRPKAWYNQVLRLRCPEYNQGRKEIEWTTSRLDLDLDDSCDAVLKKIFTIVGCNDVKAERLPTLKIHFSKDKKDQEFRLDSDNDWEVIKSEWKLEAAKKKDGAYGAVILSKEFMHNLRQSKIIHQSKSRKAAKEDRAQHNGNPSKASKKNGTSANFVDIYASDEDFQLTNDVVGDAEVGYENNFKRIERELLTQLRSCMVCNPVPKPEEEKKTCCLTKYGQHKALGMVQIREWVKALLGKEDPYRYSSDDVDLSKVTFKTPPDVPCFQQILNPAIPGIGGKINQSLPVRSNRQEVKMSKASEVSPVMPQINVAPQIILPPLNHFQTPMSRHKYGDALFFSPGNIIYPTVDEWLLSFKPAEVGRCDMQYIRKVLEDEAFLEFTIDLLEDYKISSFGPKGSGALKPAEEALLAYKLKKTMDQLRKEAMQAKAR